MARVSANGVLVGGVLGIGATYALSIPLMALAIVQLDLMQLPEPEFHAALMKALAPGSPYHLVGLVLGSAGGILGGYVAARIAKHDERLNGALSAWLFMLLQTYNWATGGATETALAHFGYLVASPAMGALGGYLWERTRSKALSAPITSPELFPAHPSSRPAFAASLVTRSAHSMAQIPPEAPGSTQPPPTKIERQQFYVIVLGFVIWFPLYVVWVRPLILQWISQYATSFPIILHAIPAIGVPFLASLVFGKIAMWRDQQPK